MFLVLVILGPGEVKVAMDTVGICASDVHYYTDGKIGAFRVESPMILGHEGAGEVIAVGEGVTNFAPGDRVALEPGIPDPSSRASREGNYNHDPAVRFWATPPVHGCLTEQVIHPSAYTYHLPDSLSYAEGALIEPFAVGMEAAKKAQIEPGDVALVIGCGTIGVVTAIAALAGGASKVFISDIAQEKFEAVRDVPGIIPILASVEDVEERIKQETHGWGAQVVFEASGASQAYKGIWNLASPGGVVVLVGIPTNEVSLDVSAMQARGIRIEGVFRYANVYQKAIDIAATDDVNLGALVSATFDFEDSVETFHRFLEGRPTDTKIQIRLR